MQIDYLSDIKKHLEYLAQTIGSRPSGSPGCLAAEDYIARQFQGWGYAVEKQSFDCPDWACLSIEMRCGDTPIRALPNRYSPGCNVTAGLVAVGTLAELEAVNLDGKLVLLYGDLSRQPLACKDWFLKEDRDVRIVDLLESKSPAAVAAVQHRPGSIDRLIEDAKFNLPSVTLPFESAVEITSHPDRLVSLDMNIRMIPGRTANVVARKRGKRPETIVFCAHYDTKIDTPGACDNAAGAAALLGAAEAFSRLDIDASLEFVAFSNEEYLPLGDDTYLERAGEGYLERVLLAINFDGLGGILDANTLAIYASSGEWESEVRAIAAEFPGVQWVEPWPDSNHSTFAFRGVPALALSGQAMRFRNHQLDDTVEWVDPDKVEEGIRLAVRAALSAQSKPVSWLRQPPQE